MDLTAVGSNGQVILRDDYILISHKGLANLLSAGAHGEKRVPVGSITAVQFKEAGFMAGFIQFTLVGGRDRAGGVLEATKDENAVLFSAKQQPIFQQLRGAIEARMKAQRAAAVAPAATTGLTMVEQLERLAALRDKGVLTDDEFQGQKRALLAKG